jgi:putative cell wall-binding protein
MKKHLVASVSALALGATTFLMHSPVAAATAQPRAAALPQAESAGKPDFAATSSAHAVDLTVLGALGIGKVAEVDVASSEGSANSASTAPAPKTVADASNLDIALLTGNPPDPALLAHARQTAPPDNPTESTAAVLPLHLAPLLDLGVSSAKANARWPGDSVCLPSGTPVERSSVSTADLKLLGVSGLADGVLALPDTVSTTQSTSLVAVPGAKRAVLSTAAGSAASVELFNGAVKIQVAKAPTLSAIATGVPDGAKVSWNAPLITVNGSALDVTNSPLRLNVGGGFVELSLGQPTNVQQSADGRHASADATLLHVKLGLAGITLVQADLFPLHVSATANAVGGVVCDSDGDGLTDDQENSGSENPFDHKPTDPNNPDSDGDGINDYDEVHGGQNTHYNGQPTDPNDADTDNDGLTDGQEVKGVDPDGNGPLPTVFTDPNKADTDRDGLLDGEEVSGAKNTHFGNKPTNPVDPDSDDDGILDGLETSGGTNGKFQNAPTDPNDADTDDGGVKDGVETLVRNPATDPNDPKDDQPDTPFAFNRIAGQDRYDTAARIAASFGSASQAILASGEAAGYSDALTGTYFAGTGDVPMLLTKKASTPAVVISALNALGVKKVTLMGGPAAISDAQASALQSKGFTVVRIGGADRFGTNAKVIATGGQSASDTAIVATGLNFPDALASGPLAYRIGMPLALTKTNDLPDDVLAALKAAKVTKVIIVGGETAVGPAVVAELQAGGITVTQRIAGAERSATSRLVAEYAIANLHFAKTGVDVASGYQAGTGADALAGAPLAGKDNRTLVITASAVDPGEVTTYLKAHADTLQVGTIFGGTTALTAATQKTMEDAVNDNRPKPPTP